jgi:hypothetical protein
LPGRSSAHRTDSTSNGTLRARRCRSVTAAARDLHPPRRRSECTTSRRGEEIVGPDHGLASKFTTPSRSGFANVRVLFL